ncbi:MAG TPA: hypothetical protein PLV55_02600 [Anaerohalosphaeraceae bacterium]|nr:hypothetical protein [Anaerohalosphaeraceae bacterium]
MAADMRNIQVAGVIKNHAETDCFQVGVAVGCKDFNAVGWVSDGNGHNRGRSCKQNSEQNQGNEMVLYLSSPFPKWDFKWDWLNLLLFLFLFLLSFS